MNSKVKVSICIPAYNNIESIRRLVESILNQSYGDYEVIITDDSTTDEVEQYIAQVKDERFHYIHNAEQLGATANCNTAIRKAHGEYIKVMHHDDWFTDSHSLGKMVVMLEQNENAVMAFSGTYQVSKTDRFARSITSEQEAFINTDADNLFAGNYIGAPSATIWRNCGMLFDEKIKWLVDVELYIRLLREKGTYVYSTEPLISIGISDTQVTTSCLQDRKLILDENVYVYHKLGLQKKMYCRRALYKIMRKYNITRQEIRGYGCNLIEYQLYILCQRMKHKLTDWRR